LYGFNLSCATQALKEIKKRFPYGALNTQDATELMMQSPDGITLFAEQWRMVKELYIKYPILSLETFNQEYASLLGATCDYLSQFAMQFMLNKYPSVTVEMVYLDSHHLLVIGRKLDSNPEDISTWGPDTVIVDLWAQDIYKAEDFYQHRNKAKIMRIIDVEKQKIDESTSYLNGTPKISFDITLAVLQLVNDPRLNVMLNHYKQYMFATYNSENIDVCLRNAASKGALEHTRLLINRLSANINGVSASKPFTALDWASQNNHQKCAAFLKAAGGERYASLQNRPMHNLSS